MNMIANISQVKKCRAGNGAWLFPGITYTSIWQSMKVDEKDGVT